MNSLKNVIKRTRRYTVSVLLKRQKKSIFQQLNLSGVAGSTLYVGSIVNNTMMMMMMMIFIVMTKAYRLK